MTENTDVVVIGGGYAGVRAADGHPGARLKEFVCRGIVRHLAGEARKPGSYGLHRVSGGAKRRQLLQAERGEAPATAESAA